MTEEMKDKAANALYNSRCIGNKTYFPRIYVVGQIVTFFKHVAVGWAIQVLGFNEKDADGINNAIEVMTIEEACKHIVGFFPGRVAAQVHENIETQSVGVASTI